MNQYIKVVNPNVVILSEETDLSRIVSDNSPSFSGIVSGISKGDVYLDDLKHPKAGVVYSEPVGGFSILGRLDSEDELHRLQQFLEQELFSDLLQRKWDCFEFSTDDSLMVQKIISMFSQKQMNTEAEYSFRMGNREISKIYIPSEYRIVPINRALIDEMNHENIKNSNLILDIINDSWYTTEDFLRWSLGFATIYENQIVAAIIGTSRFHQFIPIDIITEEEHRKKGLASAITAEFTKECRKRGLVAHWDCVESNIASQKTANKCGFEFLRQRNYYWFQI